jgi:hypothetical protein
MHMPFGQFEDLLLQIKLTAQSLVFKLQVNFKLLELLLK